jgi:phenol 2-monooxygenase
MLPETLSIDTSLVSDLSSHPITVTVRHLTEEEANPDAYKGEQKEGGTKSGLFRSSLLSAKEEEDL